MRAKFIPRNLLVKGGQHWAQLPWESILLPVMGATRFSRWRWMYCRSASLQYKMMLTRRCFLTSLDVADKKLLYESCSEAGDGVWWFLKSQDRKKIPGSPVSTWYCWKSLELSWGAIISNTLIRWAWYKEIYQWVNNFYCFRALHTVRWFYNVTDSVAVQKKLLGSCDCVVEKL